MRLLLGTDPTLVESREGGAPSVIFLVGTDPTLVVSREGGAPSVIFLVGTDPTLVGRGPSVWDP